MYTMTTDIARQLVSDRLREADGRRLARKFRGRKSAQNSAQSSAQNSAQNSVQAGSAGSGATERVVRRAKVRPAPFISDIIGAR